MAGLTGGSFYGLKVSELDNAADNNNESNGTTLGADGQSAFSLVNLGDVSAKTGADIQADSEADEVTEFLRPEDGQWGTVDPDIFYFVTTNGFGSPSRLWAAAFNDASDPTAGGTIKLLLDGTEGQQMLDNMTVNEDGKIIMQEDPGNNAHLAKVWEYDPETDELTQLAQHDPDRFITGRAELHHPGRGIVRRHRRHRHPRFGRPERLSDGRSVAQQSGRRAGAGRPASTDVPGPHLIDRPPAARSTRHDACRIKSGSVAIPAPRAYAGGLNQCERQTWSGTASMQCRLSNSLGS